MKQILVTGAAGAVGKRSCRHLTEGGWTVIGLDRVPDPGICHRYFQGDCGDRELLREAMRGCTALLHLAANPAPHADFLRSLVHPNIVAVWTTLEVAVEVGIRRAVLASSINAVNGAVAKASRPAPVSLEDPGNPYGLTKLFLEHAAAYFHRQHGLSSVCARIAAYPQSPSSVARLMAHPSEEPYLSHDDWRRFLDAALERELGFAVVHAQSLPKSDGWYLDPEAGRQILGYDPLDAWPNGLEAGFLGAPLPEMRPPLAHFFQPLTQISGDPRTVFVTGSAGRVGRGIAAHLRGKGWTVVGYDREPDPTAKHRHIQGDLLDRDQLSTAMLGCGAVVHLAGDPDPRHSFEALVDPNICGWWSVLETAYRLGVPRVVFASSLHVSGAPSPAPNIRPADAQTPENPYGVSKLFGEHAGRLVHRLTGIEVASLRLGLVATSDADLAYSINQHGQFDFIVSVEDASRAIEAVLTVPELGYAQFNVTSNCDPHPSRFPLGADAVRVGYVPQDTFSSVDLRSG